MRLIPSKIIRVVAALSLAQAASLRAQNSTIDSLTGQVTAHEISTFKSAIAGLVPGGSNGGNNYAYGGSGDAMEACADMYYITKDRSILDKLVLYCDKVVSIRNTNRVMWTGIIDPVWPNNSTTTWGCEQGDVAGHLAYCAQLIGQNPSLWNLNVGIGDTNGYGATYKARAATYLTVVDATMQLFYTNNFIHADEYMQTPPTPPWPEPNSANDAVPWNQVSMICAALIRGADAHSRFGDASPNIARFRKTAQASIDRFFIQANNFRYTRNSKTVCKWSYSGGYFAPGAAIRYTEDCAHGGYDITQIHRSKHWLPGTPVMYTNALMVADTLMEVIKTSTNMFWSRVDGTGSLSGGMKNSWTYLAEWRSDAYAATTKTGSQYYADAAKKLWIKNAMANGWPASVSLGLNLPDGWLDTDIGVPSIIGDATWTNGVFTLRGSGASIGPTSDQLNLTSLSVPTDFTLDARVVSQSNTDPLARSGIMARGGTDTNSPFVSVMVTPANGLFMEYRSSAGASVIVLTNVPAVTAPCWVRLVRLGDTFTGYQSADGTNWTALGNIGVPLASTLAGLAVNSHNDAALNTSTFDNVNLVASGFALDVDPSSLLVSPGTNTTCNVVITPINGFSSTVGLGVSDLPARISASFNPAVINGSGSATLTLAASNTALPGAYSFTVTGTNGGLTVSSTVYLTVNEPPPTNDTHIVASANAWVFRSQSTTVQSAGESLLVKRLADSNTRIAYARFNLGSFLTTHSAAGTTLAKLRLYIPTGAAGGGNLSVYGLLDNFAGTNGADGAWSSTTTTWNTQAAKSASPNDIPNSSTALPNANTTALLGSAAIPSTAGEFEVTLSLSDFNNFLTADSNQQITLLFVNTSATQITFASLANTGGYLQPTLELVSPVTDFSLVASPAAQTVSAGGNVSFNVTVAGSNGFAGTVTLDSGNLPAGMLSGFTPPTVNGSGSSTLLFNTSTDLPPDIYIFNITASSSGRERNTTLTLTVDPPDADEDGVLDWWTQQYFGHPTGESGDDSRAGDDADGDRMSNLAEFLAGTNPIDAASNLHLLSVQAQSADERVWWSAVGGIGYVVQASTNLAAGFEDISPPITAPSNGPVSYLEPGAASNGSPRFYRVRLGP